MSVVLYRRRAGYRALLPFVGAAALILLIVAVIVASVYTRAEQRFAKLEVGEARILEGKVPVRGVKVLRPHVASTEIDPKQGLIIRGHRAGLAEVIFDRADGKRFHYYIHVKSRAPIRMTLSPESDRRRVRKTRSRGTARAPALVHRRALPPPRLRKVPEVLPEVKPKGQVVEIDKPAVEKAPDKARFLSEYNSRVKEETRARMRALERAKNVVVPPTPPAPPRKAEKPGAAPGGRSGAPGPKAIAEQPRSGPPASGTSARRPGGKPEGTSLPRIARAPVTEEPGAGGKSAEGAEEPGSVLRPQAPGEGGGGEGSGTGPGKGSGPGEGEIDIRPNPGVIARALGGGFPDHLKGVKEGERTFLNTKEWKGASFFNRVKRAVAQHWNPGEVYRRRDPYGNQYGIKDRYTLVQVTLNSDGSVHKLKVINPSGVDFLDEEAVGALEAAQPFPNPPPQVQDRDGFIRFAFGFYFEVSDRPLFKIYRYGN